MQIGPARVQHELRIVQLLFDISQALNGSLNLEEMMQPVLTLIFDHFGMVYSTITLVHPDTGEIDMDLAHGFSGEAWLKAHGRWFAAITRKAIEGGATAVVKAVPRKFFTQEGLLAGPNGKGENASYISVPIPGDGGVMGAVGAGCFRFEGSSIDEDVRLLTTIAPLLGQAIRIRREASERERILRAENSRLQSQNLDRFKPAKIVGNSHAIRQVCRLITQVASSQACVLITGESGAGKELVAEAIHMNSHRSGKPFMTVNLTALAENMVESELFGQPRSDHRGSAQCRGRIEMADGGTLFLDEVSRLPMSAQVRLLRFLQDREIERPGESTTISVDTRIVSSTNRNLEDLTRTFQFRQDLYYRLNVFPIFVPPLRERKTDILMLANHFVERAAVRSGKTISRIASSAIDMLMSYYWPGNVRELESCIEHAAQLSTDGVIHGHHLPPSIQTSESTSTRRHVNLQVSLAALESELIVDALRSTGGNIADAADALGITRKLMRLRISKYGIDPQAFRVPGV